MKGAKVIFQDVHVSGHACQEEIKLIYSLVKPKYAIPIHGEYRHLTAQKHIVEDLGIPKENIFILSSGNVLELDGQDAKVTGSVHTGAIFVDGLGVGDVGNIVLRDRQHLSEDGIMIVVMTLERHSNVVLAGPDIVSRGFVYVRESEDLMEHARQVVETALDSCLENNITDWGKIKTEVKDALGEYLWKRTKRNPMILLSLWRRRFMDEISMEIEKLLDAVHRSDEYQEYQKQAAQLEADPELKARVMRFRGDNFRLQNHSDKDELFHIEEQLNQESASLRQNLKVNAYLDAELALCRLMQRICRTLVDGIDIQIPDL